LVIFKSCRMTSRRTRRRRPLASYRATRKTRRQPPDPQRAAPKTRRALPRTQNPARTKRRGIPRKRGRPRAAPAQRRGIPRKRGRPRAAPAQRRGIPRKRGRPRAAPAQRRGIPRKRGRPRAAPAQRRGIPRKRGRPRLVPARRRLVPARRRLVPAEPRPVDCGAVGRGWPSRSGWSPLRPSRCSRSLAIRARCPSVGLVRGATAARRSAHPRCHSWRPLVPPACGSPGSSSTGQVCRSRGPRSAPSPSVARRIARSPRYRVRRRRPCSPAQRRLVTPGEARQPAMPVPLLPSSRLHL